MNFYNKILSKLRYLNIINKLTFEKIKNRNYIFLYAGDIPYRKEYQKKGYVGLSIKRASADTILHNVCNPYPLNDCSVDAYQAEDVFEHIDYHQLPMVINEIYRVLKPGGYFRLSLPDYKCDILSKRVIRNSVGEIVFDEFGGGKYVDGKVVDGGHLWFPTYEQVLSLIEKTNFTNYKFYHYYDENCNPITEKIDYSKGFVQRTPDNDNRVTNPYRPLSLVVDLYK